jgi:hypothetical protein
LAGGPTLAFCVSVRGWPAIVIVAVRAVRPRFAAIDNVAVPDPEPPPLDVTQAGRPDVFHAHHICVVTVTEAEPAAALTVSVPGDTV